MKCKALLFSAALVGWNIIGIAFHADAGRADRRASNAYVTPAAIMAFLKNLKTQDQYLDRSEKAWERVEAGDTFLIDLLEPGNLCHMNEKELKVFYEALLEFLKPDTPHKMNEKAFYEKALEFYTTAADKEENPYAQYAVGCMYRDGQGAPESMSKEERLRQALYWFQRAGNQGHCYAQRALGGLYREAQGMPQNISKQERLCQARYWFHKAAIQGNGYAQLQLAQMYYRAEGLPEYLCREDRSLRGAFYWFEKSERQGFTEAHLNHLKNLYDSGAPLSEELREQIVEFLGIPYAVLAQRSVSE